MKIIKLLLLTLLFSGAITAQDCGAVLFLQEGTTLEYSDYDKKGKIIGTSKHVTKSLNKDGSKITAEIELNYNDKKEKSNYNN